MGKRNKESLYAKNKQRKWLEGIAKLIEECDDPEGREWLENFYKEVESRPLPLVDTFTNTKYRRRKGE